MFETKTQICTPLPLRFRVFVKWKIHWVETWSDLLTLSFLVKHKCMNVFLFVFICLSDKSIIRTVVLLLIYLYRRLHSPPHLNFCLQTPLIPRKSPKSYSRIIPLFNETPSLEHIEYRMAANEYKGWFLLLPLFICTISLGVRTKNVQTYE